MRTEKDDKIKVLIVDDHPVVLEGLALMLKSVKEIAVVGFAKNAEELISKAQKLLPDVVILDVMMPDSHALSRIQQLNTLKTPPHVLCCSSVTEHAHVMSLVNAGIKGYVTKAVSADELQKAIMKIHGGGNYFADEITAIILDSIRNVHINEAKNPVSQMFSDAEREIIKLICQERTVKEISEQIGMNARTLESAKLRIMSKMDVKNIAALVYFALKNKLVDVNDLTV